MDVNKKYWFTNRLLSVMDESRYMKPYNHAVSLDKKDEGFFFYRPQAKYQTFYGFMCEIDKENAVEYRDNFIKRKRIRSFWEWELVSSYEDIINALKKYAKHLEKDL